MIKQVLNLKATKSAFKNKINPMFSLSQRLTFIYDGMKIKNLFAKAFALLTLVVFTSTGTFSQTPTITSFSPTSAEVGQTVTITGTNFDATPANNVVYFGGVRAAVSAASSTQLTVTVPVGASYNKLSVAAGNLIANSSRAFAVTNPCIASTAFNSLSVFSAAATVSSVNGDNGSSDVIVAAADFDNDGKVDVLKVGGGSVSVSRNIISSVGAAISNSSFDVAQSFAVGGNLRNVIFSDLNADGKLDVLTAGANGVYYLINNSSVGSISFASAVQISGAITNVESSDFDGDGKNDILTLSGSNANIYLNTGSGSTVSFGTAFTIGLSGSSSGIDIGDLNNDGKIDFAVTGSGTTYVYINSSSQGSLSFSNTFSLPYSHTYIKIDDFDSDGLNDIILYSNFIKNTYSTGTISSSDFTQNYINLVNEGDSGYSSTDLDGDGYPECFIGTSWDKVRCLINAGTGSASSLFNAWSSVSRGTAAAADFNSDNKVDFVASMRNSQAAMTVYQNNLSNAGTISSSGTFTAFSSCSGVASTSQTTVVSGICLSGNITATAPTGFQVSLNGTTWANSVTINQSSGSASATLYVRMNALSSSPSNGNITLSSAGATNVTVAVSGVVNTCISVAASPTSLSGFSTTGANPSAAQTTSISGSGLTNDIVLTAPTGYEISLASASGYASSLTLTQTAGTVNATTIYVRLATAGTPGTYNGNLTVASTGATTVNIGLTGTVNATPLTTAVLSANQNPCGSTASGSATLVLDGDDAPFTYAWTRNGVAYSALPANAPTNLLSGTYVVTVTDASSNVVVSNSITLTNVASLTLSGETQSGTILCNGATTGAISAVISGGGTAARVLTVTNTTTSIAYFTQTPIGGSPAAGFTYEVTGLPAGTYTVVASSTSSSCTSSGSNITISEPTLVVASGTPTDACFGQSNGQILANATGGTAPYTYSIDGTNFQSTTSFTGLSAGNFTLSVKDANNCLVTSSTIVVGQPSAVLAVSNASQTNVNCFGGSTGAVTIAGLGGNAPYTYSKDGTTFQAGTTFSNLAAGTYTITIKDASGCTGTVSVTITQPAAVLAATASGTDLACYNLSTGAVSSSVTGGTAPYTYSWNSSPAQTTATATALAAGTYTVTVTDNKGCTTTASSTITQPAAYSASITAQTNVLCNGASTGAATVTATGGTIASAYAYSWSTTPTQTTASATGLVAGTYTATITDDNSCTTTASVTITEPASAVSSSITAQTNVLCKGAATGVASVTAAGGTVASTYTYSWNTTPAQTGATATGLVAGTYIVTVTDDNNCTSQSTVTITEPAAALVASISAQTNQNCNGQSIGAATVLATGGTVGSGYTYSWSTSPVQTTASISSLAAGIYLATITDGNGCTDTVNAIITEPAVLTVSNTVTNVGCYGTSTGAIDATVTGGTAPFTYAWTDGASYTATTEDITTLPTGNYTLTVTDAKGCTATTGSVAVAQPLAALAVSNAVTNVDCSGASTGAIDATVAGGTAPFTYAWSDGASYTATTEDITTLPAGNYTLIVTDANLCTATTGSVAVTQPLAALAVSNAVTNVDCYGASTGAIDATVTGGTAPFTYAWSDGASYTATTEDITTLPAGNYTLIVTDANLCTATTGSVAVTQPLAALAVSNAVTNVDCYGNSTGAIDATVTGGTAPFTYAWSDGASYTATTEDITTLPAGNYTLIVTDAKGCTATTGSISVTEPAAALTASTNLFYAPVCYNVNDGKISSSVTGGTSPYTYAWTGGSTNDTVYNASQLGTYYLTVTDANGCTAAASGVFVPVVAQLSATSSVTPVSCNAGTDGIVTISAFAGGASGTYNYSFDGGTMTNYTSGNVVFNGLSAGAYTLVIQDANNTSCTETITITVTEPVVLSATVVTTNISCNAGTNGTITVSSPAGGAGTYEYSKDNGSTWQISATFSGLAAGTYQMSIRDAVNTTCVIDLDGPTNTTLTQPAALTASITAQTNNVCNGGSTGTATVTPVGGTAPYTYVWSNGATTASISSLAAGTYTVTVTDANSCTTTSSVTITEPSIIAISNDGISDAFCSNTNDGAIPITASGGTGAYTYAWTGPNGFTSTNEDQNYNLAPGTYAVTVTDANGCQTTLSNLVVGAPSAVVIALTGTNISCYNLTDGAVAAAVSGGSPAYSFQWTKDGAVDATTQNISSLTAGVYQLTVTDANFCSYVSSTVTITEPAELTATVAANASAVCSGENVLFTLTGTAGEVITYSINSGTNATATIGAGGTVVVTVNAATVDQTIALVSVSDGSCTNVYSGTATTTINALPTPNAGADQTVCNAENVTLTGTGVATLAWDNSVVNGVAFVASNVTSSPVTTTYTLTETDANGCVGTDQVLVTVNPTPTVDAVADEAICVNTATTAVNFTSSFNVSGTTYSWTNNNASIGLAASGTGNISSFTGLNTGTTDAVATITVTPSANNCDGTPITFTITVNPTPIIASKTDAICSAGSFTVAPTNGSGDIVPTGTTYSWSAPTVAGITGTASGTNAASISGTLINTTNSPITVNYSVTPSATNSTSICTGAPFTVAVTVNPSPIANAGADQTVCVGASVTLAGTGVDTYTWDNSVVDNTAFTAVNATNASITTTYTMTATDGNGCTSSDQVAVTVEPTPIIANTVDTICSVGTFNVTPANGSGNTVPTGTTYTWSAPTVAGITGTTSGTNATSISGTLTNTTDAAINVTYTVTPTYVEPTPTIGSNYGGGIIAYILQPGDAGYVAGITKGLIAAPTDQSSGAKFGCQGQPLAGAAGTAVGDGLQNTIDIQAGCAVVGTCADIASNLVLGGYSDWFVPSRGEIVLLYQNIGPGNALGLGNIGNFASADYWTSNKGDNLGAFQCVFGSGGTINTDYRDALQYLRATRLSTITSSSTSCSGSPFTVTVSIEPTPIIAAKTATICSASTFNVAPATGGSDIVPTGTTYTWTVSANANVTGQSDVTTGVSSISQNLVNTTNTAQTVTYTVTPTSGTCVGAPFTVTVTVDPTPTIAAQTATICSGGSFTVTPTNGTDIVPSGTTYAWSAPSVTGITGTASGSSATSITGTLTNTTNAAIVVNYIVTPTSGICAGVTFNVDVTVEPTPIIAAATATICSGSAFTVAPTNGSGNIVPTGTTYTWTVSANANVTGQSDVTTGASSISQTLTNTTNTAETVTYTVTPTSGTCVGASFSVTVTVDPTPTIADESTAICSGDAFLVTPSSSSASAASDLFISEYVEGSSNNKYIEIFNGTGSSVDLSDYRLRLYANGASTPNNDVILSGALANNSTLVYSHSSATAYTGSSTTNAAVGFSGDDAVALYKISSSSFVDIFGRIGDDPGSAWSVGGNSTVDKTLVRNSNITGGVTASPTGTGPTAFSTLATEWTQFNQDDVSNLGTHTYGTSNSNIIPAAITYSWPAPAAIVGITGLSSGTAQSTIGGTLTNSTNTAIQVTYVVTPTSGSCPGATFNVVVTVNPVPSVVAQTASVCTGSAFSVAPANGSGNIVPTGTTYDWSAPAAITGISGLTAGIAQTTIGGTLSNSTSAPIDVVYSVTPTSGSCVGSVFTVTVTVNPTPIVSDQTIATCSASAFTVSPVDGNNNDVVPTTTTYSWSAPAAVTGITGLALGTNEANFNGTLTNTTTSAISVTYVVTPTSGTCVGSTFNVVVTINPTPVVAAKTATVCSADAFSVAPVDGVSGDIVPAGTTYDWSAPSAVPGITGLSSGIAQSTINGTLTNTTNAPITLIYSVTPSISNCVGTAFNVTVTVNPVPVITNTTLSSCSGSLFSFTPSGSSDIIPTGTTYTWTFSDNPFVVGEANQQTAQTSLDQTLINLSSTAQTVVYTVTPISGSCVGSTFTLSATINPLPVVSAITGASNVCAGLSTTLASSTTGGTWSSSNTAIATVGTTGVVTGVAAGSATITYSVTNVSGCSASTSASMTVNAGATASITTGGATTFCSGGSVVLTANAGSSYLWSNGLQTQSIAVTSSGSYTVTVTNAAGCSVTSSVTPVTVNALPVVAAITGSSNVCTGSTTTLASSTTGGTWSSSNNAVATVSTTGVVTGVAAGSAVISYSVTSNGCTSATTASMTVNPSASATIASGGATTFCAGGSVVLTASSGSSYLWSNGAPTQSITVAASGSYFVTVTNAAGCSVTSSVTAITVNPLPVVASISGASNVCVGSTAILTNTTSGGVWSSANTALATVSATGVVTGAAAGTTTITYSVTTNGCTSSTSASLTVNAGAPATVASSGATTFCAGGSVVLTASAGSSYLWSNGAPTQSITVTNSGSYTVTVTNASGCSATSVATPVTVNALPVVAAITGSSNVCTGSTTTLASSTTGGTWSSSNNAVATVSTTGVVSGVTSGLVTITYTVTNASGCSASSFAFVTVNTGASASITAGSATTFCSGGSVVLTASPGSSYLWSNGAPTQSITVTSSGTYSVIVTNAGGCSATSAGTAVTVNTTPVVAAITGATSVCQGSTTVLASSTAGGTWSSSNTTVATVSASGVVTGAGSGSAIISYTVTNANGCSIAATASVTVNATPTVPVITANGSITVCPSSSVVLTSSPGLSYTWNTGATTASITVNQTGSYTVTVANASGCTAQSVATNVVVEDVTPPVLVIPGDIAASANVGCDANVAIGNALATDNCALATLTNDAPVLFPVGTTTVTWTATDASGNITVLTQLITVVDDIDPTILVPVGVIAYASTSCEAANVDLGTPTASDNCPAGLVVTNNAPTTYPIGSTVVVWTATDAAGNTTTASQSVTVFDTVVPTVLANDYEITLNANGQGSIDFNDIDAGSFDNCGIASVSLSQTSFDCDFVGNNQITVYVTDNSGNTTSVIVNVFVNASDACGGDSWNGPSIPQAFTPNGNNINDVFEIPGLEGYDLKELYVYDRYGGMVYSSKDYQNDWNGTNGSGDNLPDATYYYLLRVSGGKEKAGYVYINRVKQ